MVIPKVCVMDVIDDHRRTIGSVSDEDAQIRFTCTVQYVLYTVRSVRV
jgi:hypothetical protein